MSSIDPDPNSPMARAIVTVGAAGFCFLGVVMLAAGIVGTVAEYPFATDAVRTTGHIVSVEREWAGFSHGKYGKPSGTRPRYEYRVTYRYVDRADIPHDGRFTTDEDKYRQGAEVNVEYLANAPQRSRLADSPWIVWGRLVGLIVVGLLLSAMGALGIFCRFRGCDCHTDSNA